LRRDDDEASSWDEASTVRGEREREERERERELADEPEE